MASSAASFTVQPPRMSWNWLKHVLTQSWRSVLPSTSRPTHDVRQRSHPLGHEQAAFGLAVRPLERAVGRVAAGRVEVELLGDRRPAVCRRAHRVEVGLRRAEADCDVVARRLEGVQRLDLGDGRPAAVVADAEEAHRVGKPGRLLFQRAVNVGRQVEGARAVAARDAEGHHPAAVGRLPPERLRHARHLVRAGPHEDIRVAAALAEDLRQRLGVAEAVHAIGHGRLDPQHVAHVRLAEQEVADERLPLRQVHVGLDDHAVDDVPAPLADARHDLGKERGILPLDPVVDLRLAAHEVEVGVLPQPVGGRAAGGERLRAALGPAPKPGRVQVRLADHVDGGFGHG